MTPEHTQKLLKALQHYDLDTVTALLKDHLHQPPKQARSNLKNIFHQAQQDHLNLLHPPPDFQHWLQTPLTHTIKGPHTASNNTITARLTTLSNLYTFLLDQDLILKHPLRKLERPPNTAQPHTPPPDNELQRLLEYSKQDPHLHAALLLLTKHALHVTELLNLRWPHLDYATGTLLRKHTTIQLDPQTFQALDKLLAHHGGPLHTPDTRIFPYQNQDALRTRIFQTTRAANLPFIGPARLRKVALNGRIEPAPLLNTPMNPRITNLAETLAQQKKPPKIERPTKKP